MSRPEEPNESLTALWMPSDFPIDDLEVLAGQLERAAICVPGYIPPDVGLYDVRAHLFSHRIEDESTIVLPDRNVASRIAQLARGWMPHGDTQLQLAAVLLAYCQCLDIQFEPSIAFHELGHHQGHASAVEELGFFRAADLGDVREVVEVAMQRRHGLTARIPQAIDVRDLSRPIDRWNRNYVIALKMLELERAIESPLKRLVALLTWMREDFIFGGPAALLACVYFGPNSPPRRGVFKRKNSADRESALAGARNAAWDLTHLSEFIRNVNATAVAGDTRYLFVSFDVLLRKVVRLLFEFGTKIENLARLPEALTAWWSPVEARTIATQLAEHIAYLSSPQWTPKTHTDPDFIPNLIRNAEARVRAIDGVRR